MDYQEFCNQLKEEILKKEELGITEEAYSFYPKGFISEREEDVEFIKETNRKYHQTGVTVLMEDYICLLVKLQEMESVCRFQVRQLYMKYESIGFDGVLGVVEEHLKLMKKVMGKFPIKATDSFATAKPYLTVHPMNFHDHRLELEDVHYKVCGDIALVVYMMFFEKNHDCGGFKVTQRMTKDWGVDFEEIFECAMENAEKKDGAQIRGVIMGQRDKEMFFVSNGNGRVGAIAMFYPNLLRRLSNYLGEDFYVVFISCAEAIVERTCDTTPEEIKERLRNVNRECGEDGLLSRDVFLYDVKEKEMKVVGTIRVWGA